MISKLENKSAVSPVQRDRLVDALLQSPLARELERSLSFSAEAVRERAREALATISLDRANKLAVEAQELARKRDALKAEYEAASARCAHAADRAALEREHVASLRSELKAVSSAGEGWLRANGLETVADVERRFRLKPTCE